MGAKVWNLPGGASAGRWADGWVEDRRLRRINRRSPMVGVCRLTHFFQLSCMFGNFHNTTPGWRKSEGKCRIPLSIELGSKGKGQKVL